MKVIQLCFLPYFAISYEKAENLLNPTNFTLTLRTFKNWISTRKLRSRRNKLRSQKKEEVRGRKRTISRVRTLKAHFLSFGATFFLSHPCPRKDQMNAAFNQCHPGDQEVTSEETFGNNGHPHCFLDSPFLLDLSSGHSLDIY
ncbi:hypothetical protein CEXT_401531 [Caerostris extrusa]|uniref:Uncharacterized protein n=1 Tax=Caerostris extrusa TaxID=172846 RepID=A0AAV4NJ37_CAEEX|nr:hypothetical protein CEXT_401531 [Caerostris extrusa]